jgi:hypothetical protein
VCLGLTTLKFTTNNPATSGERGCLSVSDDLGKGGSNLKLTVLGNEKDP